MGFKLSKTKTPEKLLDGIWVTYYEGEDGKAEVKLAPMNNHLFTAYLDKLVRDKIASRVGIRKNLGDENSVEFKECKAAAIAMHVFKGWKGFDDDNGQEYPDTFESRYTAILENPEFMQDIVVAAARLQADTIVEENETLGN